MSHRTTRSLIAGLDLLQRVRTSACHQHCRRNRSYTSYLLFDGWHLPTVWPIGRLWRQYGTPESFVALHVINWINPNGAAESCGCHGNQSIFCLLIEHLIGAGGHDNRNPSFVCQ
jgi:hypothetical protein